MELILGGLIFAMITVLVLMARIAADLVWIACEVLLTALALLWIAFKHCLKGLLK